MEYLSDRSLVRDIELANKKIDYLNAVKACVLTLLLGEGLFYGLDNLFKNSSEEVRQALEMTVNSFDIGVVTAVSLNVIYNKIKKVMTNDRLEKIVDILEDRGIFVGVDSLKSAKVETSFNYENKSIDPYIEESEVFGTAISDVEVLDRKGDIVVLKEYRTYLDMKGKSVSSLALNDEKDNVLIKKM